MDNLNLITSESLDRYFQLLSKTGYFNNKLLVILTAINYIINTFPMYITDSDLLSITNTLLCIYGNCIIPYNNELSDDSLINIINRELQARITEDNITRFSESNMYRISSKY